MWNLKQRMAGQTPEGLSGSRVDGEPFHDKGALGGHTRNLKQRMAGQTPKGLSGSRVDGEPFHDKGALGGDTRDLNRRKRNGRGSIG